MTLGYTARAAPMQVVFHRGGQLAAEYVGDAFVTFCGSRNREALSGDGIVRVHLVDGQAKSLEPFIPGFLTNDGTMHIARPVGLAVAKIGSLLMADDPNGVIYRVACSGGGRGRAVVTTAPPASRMLSQAARGDGVPFANDGEETRALHSMADTATTITKTEPFPSNTATTRNDGLQASAEIRLSDRENPTKLKSAFEATASAAQ